MRPLYFYVSFSFKETEEPEFSQSVTTCISLLIDSSCEPKVYGHTYHHNVKEIMCIYMVIESIAILIDVSLTAFNRRGVEGMREHWYVCALNGTTF